MEDFETVAEHCTHTDCVYRVTLDGYLPACYYAALEHQVRGCKISECTRYKSGKPKQARMDREYTIYWEYYYDEDADSIW